MARADVAEFMLKVLESDEYDRKGFAIGGLWYIAQMENDTHASLWKYLPIASKTAAGLSTVFQPQTYSIQHTYSS